MDDKPKKRKKRKVKRITTKKEGEKAVMEYDEKTQTYSLFEGLERKLLHVKVGDKDTVYDEEFDIRLEKIYKEINELLNNFKVKNCAVYVTPSDVEINIIG